VVSLLVSEGSATEKALARFGPVFNSRRRANLTQPARENALPDVYQAGKAKAILGPMVIPLIL
jgi:hypothetical protein